MQRSMRMVLLDHGQHMHLSPVQTLPLLLVHNTQPLQMVWLLPMVISILLVVRIVRLAVPII